MKEKEERQLVKIGRKALPEKPGEKGIQRMLGMRFNHFLYAFYSLLHSVSDVYSSSYLSIQQNFI